MDHVVKQLRAQPDAGWRWLRRSCAAHAALPLAIFARGGLGRHEYCNDGALGPINMYPGTPHGCPRQHGPLLPSYTAGPARIPYKIL